MLSRQTRHKLLRTLVVIMLCFLICSPCIFHITMIDYQRQKIAEEISRVDGMFALKNVVLDIYTELMATIEENSTLVERQRSILDRTVLKLEPNFKRSSFILGSLIKTRLRFIHALSGIRQEVDHSEISLPTIVMKYITLAHFVRDNIGVDYLFNPHNSIINPFVEAGKSFLLSLQLYLADLLVQVDCLPSSNTTANGTSWSNINGKEISHLINNVVALRQSFGTRRLYKEITEEEWNSLMLIRQRTTNFPSEHNNATSFQTRKEATCWEIQYQLHPIVKKMSLLSIKQHLELKDFLKREYVEVNKAVSVYAVVIVLNIGIFIIVCWMFKCNVQKVETLGSIKNYLDKQFVEEQERISNTIQDIIPSECISVFMGNKANKTDRKSRVKKRSKFLSIIKPNFIEPSTSRTDIHEAERTEIYIKKGSIDMHLLRTPSPRPLTGALDSATLFLCDFIHLNKLVSLFEPEGLINLVTCLIKILEERTKLYDVNVVNRNIDAFAVMCGMSPQQRSRHASEIANMSLDIMASCSDLELNVVPDSKLRMRISVHTAPCVYSLSPFPKPRFKIYGNITEVAVHLMRKCPPNRIHVSDQVARLLRKDHAYDLQNAGFTFLPTGEYMNTNWLLGRRVSVCLPNKDTQTKHTLMKPLELEMSPIYRFDRDKIKYVPPSWMGPSPLFLQTSPPTSLTVSEECSRQSPCPFNFGSYYHDD